MIHTMKFHLVFVFLFTALLFAGDTVRPGLEPLENEFRIPTDEEKQLVMALKTPLIEAKNVLAPLQKWFDGRLLSTQGKKEEALKTWKDGLKCMDDLKPLPQPKWQDMPDASFTVLTTLNLPSYRSLRFDVVQWKVANLNQYGGVIRPASPKPTDKLPVILYCHGAAFGIPTYFLGWLAELAEQGYVIACPAMRGEPLFQQDIEIKGKLIKCEGDIENLEGEVDDCLSMLRATWKLPYAQPDSFAMIGHSFGAGVGLLAAARAGERCKAVVSYDAWLVTPQRYYWDRMARGANNWLSWADFCNQPVDVQLRGLMTRSIVHNAEKLSAKVLLFIGGAYEGSVFHQSHDDLISQFKRLNKHYSYHVMPNGGHNFVLYTESKPAQDALKIQTEFLDKYYPPAGKNSKGQANQLNSND